MYIGADVTGCVAAGMGVVRSRASKDRALTMHGAAPQVCAMSRGGDALVSNRCIRSVRPCTGLFARNSARSFSITACVFKLCRCIRLTHCTIFRLRPDAVPSPIQFRRSDRSRRMPFRSKCHVPPLYAPDLSDPAMCNVSATCIRDVSVISWLQRSRSRSRTPSMQK